MNHQNWYKKAKYEDFDKWEELEGDHKDYLIEEMFDQGRIDAENPDETFVGINTKVKRPGPDDHRSERRFDIKWEERDDSGVFESSKIYLKNGGRIHWRISNIRDIYCCEAILSDSNGQRIGELEIITAPMSDISAKNLCESHAKGLKVKENWDTLNNSISGELEESEDGDIYSDEPLIVEDELSTKSKAYMEVILKHIQQHMNSNSIVEHSVDSVLSGIERTIAMEDTQLSTRMRNATVKLRSIYLKASEVPSGDFNLNIIVDEEGARHIAADLAVVMEKMQ